MQATSDTLTWLPLTTTSTHDAAALYIDHGLRVVIVHGIRDDGSCTCVGPGEVCKRTKPGKHPVVPAWQKKKYDTAEAYRDAIDAPRMPTPTNIGIVLGPQPNGDYILAVDADDATRMAELEAVVGVLPVTVTARSGGGNNHRIYALGKDQDPKRMKNRTGVRLDTESPTPGVDVKVSGGQIVVCPSRHASGERYSWAVAAPIADFPRAWYDLVADPIEVPRVRTATNTNVIPFGDRYLEQVIDNNCKDMAGRGKGERNSVLFAKACTVLEHCAGAGRSFSVALPRLREAGLACGLPKHEVDDVLRKAETKVRSTGNTKVPEPMQSRTRPSYAPSSARGLDSDDSPESLGADAEIVPAVDVDWMNDLARSKTGSIKSTLGNAVLVIRHDEFFKGRVSFNRMRVTPCIDGRPLQDADLARFRVEMEKRWGFAPGKETMADAVVLVGDDRSFHPVQDYLNGLTWDGAERISKVASAVLGISNPDAMTNRVLRAWFVSAVARALAPGCKVDTTLVLAGPQGFKKSTFFATLGGEWFTDTYVDVRNKDGLLQVHAAWIYEWGEIERVTTRTSSSDVKAFLSSARDDLRPPYGRGIVNQARSGVVVGTTNKAFLDDETGSRRFHPVKVEQMVNVEQLRAWRDQLWAEAVAAFRAGEAWWLTEEEDLAREAVADEHMVENPWLEKVETFLRDPTRRQNGVTIADVMAGALGLDIGRAHHGDAVRAGKVLKRLKWWSRHETRGDARARIHYPRAVPVPGVSECARSQDACSVHDCSPDQSVNLTPEHSAQYAHSTRTGERVSVEQTSVVGVPERESAHACDHAGKLGNDPDTVRIPCRDHDSPTGVFRATLDTVQDEESGLSEWLSEQGIEPHSGD